MDLLLICIAGGVVLLGIAGSFLPIIPGPLTSWLGLLILHFTPSVFIETSFLIITFFIALFFFFIDNIISVLGAKVSGGGRGSIIGSTIGLILGVIFLGPFGIILGPFFGAFFGEIYVNKDNHTGAFRAASGVLAGFLTGVFLKLIIGLAFAYYFIKIIWRFTELIF